MWSVVVVALGTVLQSGAVRLTDTGVADDESAACVDALKEVYGRMNFRSLFKPVLEGTYQFQNRYTGEYMTATEEGLLGGSRSYVDISEMSDWQVRWAKDAGVTPSFTVRNLKSRKFLGTKDGALTVLNQAQRWYIEIDTTGIYNTISPVEGSELKVIDISGSVVLSGEDLGSFENWRSQWDMKMIGKPHGRVRPRSQQGEYEWQWKQAGRYPMWKGGNYTYNDMCVEAGQAGSCHSRYADVRSVFLASGKVSETGRNNVATASEVDKCDTPIAMERQRWLLPGALQAAKDSAGPACASFNLQSVSALMRQGIEETCYSACLTKIQEKVSGYDCDGTTAEEWMSFMLDLVRSTECDVAASTLALLVEYAMQTQCWTWSIPSPLWLPDDKGPGKTNLARVDGNAVCSSDRRASTLQQNGQCVEGTTCECPRTWLTQHESLAEMRMERFQDTHDQDGIPLPNFFIADTSEGWTQILTAMGRAVTMASTTGVLIFGNTLGAAILAAPFGIPMALQTSMALRNLASDAFSWSCDKVVGCWPQEPKRVQTSNKVKACRLPDETKSGGSPVWFMPPPGFMLKHRTWRTRKCIMTFCEGIDMKVQKVGFDGRNVYNCQMLSFQDMSTDQQAKYMTVLRQTIPDEYKAEI